MLLQYVSEGGLSTDSLRVRSHTSYSGGKALLGFDRAEISPSLPPPVAQLVLANTYIYST